MEEWLKAIFNYGFPSVALVGVAYFSGKLILKVIAYNKEREDKLMQLIQVDILNLSTNFNVMVTAIADFRKANDEAHKYQREEHSEIRSRIEKIEDKVSTICKVAK